MNHGGPGRTRTSNQTVMSGPVSPESSNKIDVFRRVRARSFASVHGVSVVYLWSVRHFPRPLEKSRGSMMRQARPCVSPSALLGRPLTEPGPRPEICGLSYPSWAVPDARSKGL
jgi:hypothetical protein